MLNVIGTTNRYCHVVSVEPGDSLEVAFILADTVKSVGQVVPFNGHKKVSFFKAALLVVEGLNVPSKRVKHLRFAQMMRNEELIETKVTKWPRMRVALTHIGHPRIHIPGGLEYAALFEGQMLVADFSMDGSHGWLIEEKDNRFFLSQLPELKDSGQLGEVFIHWYLQGENWFSRETDVEPVNLEKRGNYVYRVSYDKRSLFVKGITCDGAAVQEAAYLSYTCTFTHPVVVGKRLPHQLRDLS